MNRDRTYCREHCRGFQETGGLCFADGECEEYTKNTRTMIVISTANTKHLVNENTIESVTFDSEQHTATITRPQLEPGHLSTQTIPDVEYIRTLGENERVSWNNSELKRTYELATYYCNKANAYMDAFDRLRKDASDKICRALKYLPRENNPEAYDYLSGIVDGIDQGEYNPDLPLKPQQI